MVLISDCLSDDGPEALLGAVGRLRARGDEVLVLRVSSRLELGETESGPARYFDPEQPARIVPGSPDTDAGFRDRVAAYYQQLRLGLEERGAEYVPLTTDQPLLTAIGGWLRQRNRHAHTPA